MKLFFLQPMPDVLQAVPGNGGQFTAVARAVQYYE